MTEPVKAKKSVKRVKNQENAPSPTLSTVSESPPEPKQRKSRAKPKPTKEEMLKILSDSENELKQIIQDLKDDEIKCRSMPLKKVPELVTETIKNLEEDLLDIQEHREELMSPDPVSL